MTGTLMASATVLGAGRCDLVRDVMIAVTWLAAGGVRARWLVVDGTRVRVMAEAYGRTEGEARETLNAVLVGRLAANAEAA
jgi:hypothetical protein